MMIIIHLQEMAAVYQILIFLSNIPKDGIVHNVITTLWFYCTLWLNEKKRESAFSSVYLSTGVICFEPAVFFIW